MYYVQLEGLYNKITIMKYGKCECEGACLLASNCLLNQEIEKTYFAVFSFLHSPVCIKILT